MEAPLLALAKSIYYRASKLTDLWNTSLLFDLNYKFTNGSSSFSPG